MLPPDLEGLSALPAPRDDAALVALTRTYLQNPPDSEDPAPSQGARADDNQGGDHDLDQNLGQYLGQQVGSYRITRALGQGGMGVVYEAVHVQLGRRAAVKTLKPELSLNRVYAQRFFTEARALSVAEHPSLVKVFDYGHLSDQTLYILMEFLEGEPLSSRLVRGPLDEATALRLARQIASAVQAAHARGIVHRDLKPANIFVVPDPEAPAGERVKLLDFGLARIAASTQDAPRQTTTGVIMGTPVYMSPEQCRGLLSVDGQTDVYALGVLLFEMLAGSPPFVADTAGDLIAMHLGQRPPTLRHKAPAASAAVAALVADMLKKEAAERPTMEQVAQRLLQMSATERPAARAPRLWVIGLGIAAVVGMILLGSPLFRSRSRQTAAPSPPSLVPKVQQPAPAGPADPPPAPAQLPPLTRPEAERALSKLRTLRPQPLRERLRPPPANKPPDPPAAEALPKTPGPSSPARPRPTIEEMDVPALR